MGNSALFWLCLLWIYAKRYKGFHYCSVGVVDVVVFIWTLPYCAKVISFFLGMNRDVRGGSDLSQVATTATGGTTISQAPGCGEVPESWLLLLLNDHISSCCVVSFSFCSVPIINNTANVEYVKRWLLLLSCMPTSNTNGYWGKSALSVHLFAWYIPWVLSFPPPRFFFHQDFFF